MIHPVPPLIEGQHRLLHDLLTGVPVLGQQAGQPVTPDRRPPVYYSGRVPIAVRVPQADELRSVARTVAIALLFSPGDDEAWAKSEPSWKSMSSLAAFEVDESDDIDNAGGGRPVGHAGQFLVETVVPGGIRLGTGAVSRVGILPTYRRRGLATRLMEALVVDAVERSLPLMSLRASEAVIYERHGFGVAGEFAKMTLDAARARPVANAAPGDMTILAPGDILDTVAPIYEQWLGAAIRPGAISRPDSFWRRYFQPAIDQTDGSFVAVHHSPDSREPDGYVHYDVAWADESSPDGTGKIHELFGLSADVELAMWDYLCSIDLVRTWTAWERPVDDLIRFAAADRRAYRVESVSDEQWLRLVDVDRCLSARTFNPVRGTVVFAVTDPLIEANNRTWRIDAGGVSVTDEPPQCIVDIATLSAAYLGGTSWWSLDGSGRLDWVDGTDRAETVAVADRLFASRPFPFCGSFF